VVALFALLLTAAHAQDNYPSKSITLIVPFAAGGSTDVIGRIVAEGLRQVLGQTVVVDNRGGAGGSIGTAAVAKAARRVYPTGVRTLPVSGKPEIGRRPRPSRRGPSDRSSG
jgi:tripartite-type tricarboxylate transporter receptor subunit TctC